jgi:hypothetical protein
MRRLSPLFSALTNAFVEKVLKNDKNDLMIGRMKKFEESN